MREIAKKGSWDGGQVLGYDIVNRSLEVNEKESKIVEGIFHLREQKNSYKAIANVLNEQGEVTKTGKSFSAMAIKQIVENPVYVGKVKWATYSAGNIKGRKSFNVDAGHESIIS